MSKHILFIDDESWSVKAYFEKLQDHDLEVDLALDGDEAIARMQLQRYDLVVLDIKLPLGEKIGIDVESRKAGEVLLRRLRAVKEIFQKPATFAKVTDRILELLQNS